MTIFRHLVWAAAMAAMPCADAASPAVAPAVAAAAPVAAPEQCVKLPPGFGVDCIPAFDSGTVSKPCIADNGEAAIQACTKQMESPEPQTRIWALMYRAIHYGNLKRYDLATRDFSTVLESKPDMFVAILGRAATYIMMKDFVRARADIDHAATLEPNSFVVHLALCGYYASLGDQENAGREARLMREVDPQTADGYFFRGSFFERFLRADNQALKDYTKAVELNPALHEARLHRSNIYVRRGDFSSALDDCNKAKEAKAPETGVHYCFGFAYEMSNRYDEAVDEFGKTIALDPKNADALQNRGSLFVLTGRYAEAIPDLDGAIALRQDEMGYFVNRGLAHRHLGHNELALADYTKALELQPGSAAVYVNRGSLFLMMLDFDRAKADFEKALELQPGNVGALRGMNAVRLKVIPDELTHAPQVKQVAVPPHS
jgi:tetratricopeptide (TPR) repeat protein